MLRPTVWRAARRPTVADAGSGVATSTWLPPWEWTWFSSPDFVSRCAQRLSDSTGAAAVIESRPAPGHSWTGQMRLRCWTVTRGAKQPAAVRLGARRCTTAPSARTQSPGREMLTRRRGARGSPTRPPETDSTADDDQPRYRISKPTRSPLPPGHMAGPGCGSTALGCGQRHLCPSRASTRRLITHVGIRQDGSIRPGFRSDTTRRSFSETGCAPRGDVEPCPWHAADDEPTVHCGRSVIGGVIELLSLRATKGRNGHG